MSPESRIPKLRELTARLPAFPEEVAKEVGFKEHQMERGHSFSWNLMSRPEISVARWFNSSGTAFPVHSHAEREWIIVFKGSLFLKLEDQDEVRLLSGMYACINPGVEHSLRFEEDCFYLAVTIPRAKAWPE